MPRMKINIIKKRHGLELLVPNAQSSGPSLDHMEVVPITQTTWCVHLHVAIIL